MVAKAHSLLTRSTTILCPVLMNRPLADMHTTPVGVSDEDEAFSFPVTPPSEPAAPGAVFSSWASIQSGGRPHKVRNLALNAWWCGCAVQMCIHSKNHKDQLCFVNLESVFSPCLKASD